MGENNRPPLIILPNDPMSGEIKITYALRSNHIEIDSKGSDVRAAALATLAAAQGLVNQAFEAAGLIVSKEGDTLDAKDKQDDKKGH